MLSKNILIFMTNGLRAEILGVYGNPILKTLGIDALVCEGSTISEQDA